MEIEGLYAVKQFQELCRLHGMSLLIHSRSTFSRELARKLRPEFSKLYLTTEVRNCTRLVSRLNVDPSGAGGIDLIIADYDQNTLRLLEFVNKRPTMPETSKLPIIPIIILSADSSDPQLIESIDSVGGANAVLFVPQHTKDILALALDVLHRRRQLDVTFKELRNNQVKYPFLPVFTVSKDEIEREAREASTHQGSVFLHEDREAIFDEWAECDSILPYELMSIRNIERERRDPVEYRDRFSTNQDRLAHEIFERQVVDRKLARTAHQALADFHGMKLEPDVGLEALGCDDISVGDQTEAVDVDAANKAAQSALVVKAGVDTCGALLDVQRRPKWIVGAKGHSSAAMASDLEMRPFIDKAPPNLSRPRTVDGLDKRHIDYCWSIMRGSNLKVDTRPSQWNPNQAADSKDPPRPKTSESGRAAPSPKGGITPLKLPPRPSTSSHSEHSSAKKSTANHEASLGSGRSDASGSQRLTARGAQSLPSSKTAVTHSHVGANFKELKSEKDASRTLAKLTKETAHDLHFQILGDIGSVMHRKLNQGERDLLTEGFRLELEEDLERAHIYYTRAGMHSHEPHLSKIILGDLCCKRRRVIVAIKYYTTAIALLEELRGHSDNYDEDSFRAHYNRGVANILCGDDDTGLKDFEKALSLKPDSVAARKTLSITQRRVGKFKMAIANCLKLKDHIEAELKACTIAPSTPHPQPVHGDDLAGASSTVLHPAGGSFVLGGTHSGSEVAASSSFDDVKVALKMDESGTNVVSPVKHRIPTTHKTRDHVHLQEELENKAIASRTTTITVSESRGVLSFKEKKEMALKNALGQGDGNDSASAPRISLVAFKMKNGIKPDLFEHIFLKPSTLQEALAHAPHCRNVEQIGVIASTLRLVPLFGGLTQHQIEDLASCVEYRPVTTKGQLFLQNAAATGMCVLLRGEVEVKIEATQHTTQSLVVGHLKPFDSFGFIDILFRQEDSHLLKEIMKILKVEDNAALTSSLEAEASMSGDEDDDSALQSLDGAFTPAPARVDRDPHHTLRARAPGMFANYNMTTLCEILMVNAKDFSRLLYNTAIDEFLRRLSVIHVCGVFTSLPWQDLVRLARMSQVMTFNSGDVIIRQGTRPEYIYFMIDGLCLVWAEANNAEIYERQLIELQEKAKIHDLKYTYHHKLKTTFRRSDLPQVRNQKLLTQLQQMHTQNTGQTAPEKVDAYMDLHWETNVTTAEILRQELGVEIEKVKAKLARARQVESSKGKIVTDRKVWTKDDELTQCEVKTLRWPMLFGEASMLDPDTGTTQGTVVASTCCHVLALHKTQIQTFHIGEEILNNVRLRSVVYPDDKTIKQNLSRGKAWQIFRAKEMTRIRKTRWPMSNSDQEPFT